MPLMEPISEMQRNSAALADRAMATKEPVYLTKRGKPAVVLIDAEEFDRRMMYRDAIVAREEDRYAGIMRGHEELLVGEGVELADALRELTSAGACNGQLSSCACSLGCRDVAHHRQQGGCSTGKEPPAVLVDGSPFRGGVRSDLRCRPTRS